MTTVGLTVNGVAREVVVEPRRLLLDVLRDDLGLTSVHAACEQGACGTCNVLIDGATVRSCLTFAVQAEGRTVTTVEGLSGGGALHPVQAAFSDCHALQCGFCTPAMVLSVVELLQQVTHPTRDQIEEALSGQLCRCTGYESIVEAVQRVLTEAPAEEVGS